MIEVWKVLLSLSLSASLLFVLFLCVRPLIKDKLGRRFQYYLLLIILLRFFLPFTPSVSITGNIFNLVQSTSAYQSFFGEGEEASNTVILGDNVKIGNNVTLGNNRGILSTYAFYLWLIVSSVLLIRKVTKYQSFFKYIKSTWIPIDDPDMLNILSHICEAKKIRKNMELYSSSLIASPLLLGIRKNYIVLPNETLTENQLYYILIHETTHYQYKDMLYKWFMQLITCIHWFNPLIYYLEKLVNSECEFACDEWVIRDFTKEEAYEYGSTLIHMLQHKEKMKEKIASLALTESAREVKMRLDSITLTEQKNNHKIMSFIIVVIFLLLFYLLGAYKIGHSSLPLSFFS